MQLHTPIAAFTAASSNNSNAMSSSICTVASTILIMNLETISMMISVTDMNAVFLFIKY